MTEAKKTELMKQVDAALDEVRPHLKVDGGDVEVIDVTDDFVVKVKWLGNCENCFMSIMTMKAGIEQAIKNRLPQLTEVQAINGIEMP